MKNNNKSTVPNALEMIQRIVIRNNPKNNSYREITCTKNKINRKQTLNPLYECWNKYSTHAEMNLKKGLQKLKFAELQSAIAHIQCLAQELELFSDSLNHLSDCQAPLGNMILTSLSEIENKLFVTYSDIYELNFDKKALYTRLTEALNEKERLHKKIHEMDIISANKVKQLKNQLDAKRKEAAAAHHLVKSLKREKRRPSLKNFLCN